jgi:arylsulfatase A
MSTAQGKQIMDAPLSRRDVLKGASALGVWATLGRPAPRSGTPNGPYGSRPNVVLFFVDDMGYGDVGSYGSLISTPVLDGMAERGIRFTDFYAASPVCSPSRASLLTGGYGPRVGMPDVLWPPMHPSGLPTAERTLPEYLREAGYATGMFGKWHLGNPASNPNHHPLNHGFDRWYGIPESNDMYPVVVWDDHLIVDAHPYRTTQQGLTRQLTEKAIEWIREVADQPFFAYIPHPQPHEPLESEFRGSRAGKHGDSVEEIDHYIGVVLDELEALGIRDNTLVMFTSDNGPWYVGSSGPVFGRKRETYEGGMRVPFIAEWPAMIPGGRVYTEPAVNTDLLPTLAAAAGVALDPGRIIDGTDILPALTTRDVTVDRGDVFYYEANQLNAVRRGDWKCHRRRVSGPLNTARGYSATEETPQLFNLAIDPSESYDLSTRHPALVQELLDRMRDFDAALKADAARRNGQLI